MTITVEQLGEILPVLHDAFDIISSRNAERRRQIEDTPSPLSVEQLGERLNVTIDPNDKFGSQTLLHLADAVLTLPPDTEDSALISASYYWLIRQHRPDLIKTDKVDPHR